MEKNDQEFYKDKIFSLDFFKKNYATDFFDVEEMAGGGSDRFFYLLKLRKNGEQEEFERFVLLLYSDKKEENLNYASLAELLDKFGIYVPKLKANFSDDKFSVYSYLGDRTLYDYRDEEWGDRGILYKKSFDELVKLYFLSRNDEFIGHVKPYLQLVFDENLYEWEQEYFFDNFVKNFSSNGVSDVKFLKKSILLSKISIFLSGREKSLIHRDFQSQNVMIVGGGGDGIGGGSEDDKSGFSGLDARSYLIDFQGIRYGLPAYDVASMVYDPYVIFEDYQVDELVNYFYERINGLSKGSVSGLGDLSIDEFRLEVDYCGIQRLMQALGAYGFLSLVKDKSIFLSYIPSAVHKLSSLVGKYFPKSDLMTFFRDLDHSKFNI